MIKKGAKIIVKGENKIFTVLKKEGNFVTFYDENAVFPETTLRNCGVNKVYEVVVKKEGKR